ncbi:succinylglutamate desuccinylase/aspartoacylase family protein [Ulvibacterium sp.]|uniref:succinylglutamate desuccinylase/aspartoacylase family protein n=1 Tax=Ulvibacterium sp. TaxID=2665914 RepID=UPI00261904AA|nr:succinylglutamate desuccinylase/aspartoacylase family protein [Ulvibacterium sp.]
MIQVLKPEHKTQVKRIIGHIEGKEKGPTLLFFGGIHGNEHSGVLALEHVFQKLIEGSYPIKGNLFGIRGNIPALLEEKRYIEKDLNRMWIKSKILEIQQKPKSERTIEEKELLKVLAIVSDILTTKEAPFYFVDLHTTSSKTLPFITINDALINRKFSRLFPVPIILGIEEYLEGPLLSYINEKGYVSLGFESGQHNELEAIKNSISFLWLSLVFSGALDKQAAPDFKEHFRQLQKSAQNNTDFYEVIHRHAIRREDGFHMQQGFRSFEEVSKGTLLAKEGERELRAIKDAIIFMPLYQEQGEEGFFLIRRIPKWALAWSAFLRKIRVQAFLSYLPGISWKDEQKQVLLVDLSVAKFLTKPFFHLLGYRNRRLDKNRILMQNRERTAKNEIYRNEWWYKTMG